MYIPRCYGSIYEQDWELATALAVAAFRQQNEFINVLMDAHDKASALLGKGELICEAREILHFYQYQTYSDALDGSATISASGDSLFTDIEEGEEVSDRFRSADETVVDQSSSSFITSDMTSKHSSCHSASADDVRSASAVTAVRTADEFFTINRLSASLRVSQQIINEDSNNGLDGLGDKIDPKDVIDHDDAVEAEADDDSDGDDDAADSDDVSAELLDMQRKASEMSSSGRWVSSPPDFSSLQKKLYELTIHRDEGEQLIET